MNQHMMEDFFVRVEQEQKYLAYGEYSFEELLKKSIKDRRVRNVFVFYVLSKPEYFRKFLVLSEKKDTVRRLKASLCKALQAVEKEHVYRPEVRRFAKILRNKYFHHSYPITLIEKREEQVSKEMEKFFVSVVNQVLNEKDVNSDRDAYVASRMKEVDFDNLFVSK
ncbi:hypothetical protein [Bacillus pinisoli]|uniref:hypothetical protein n=1 Tax=Bacillus pinisoli TaxID=2901866 RepID=UPI001FF43B0C|nr:hypothetical protein [Bacillus pinisoli]